MTTTDSTIEDVAVDIHIRLDKNHESDSLGMLDVWTLSLTFLVIILLLLTNLVLSILQYWYPSIRRRHINLLWLQILASIIHISMVILNYLFLPAHGERLVELEGIATSLTDLNSREMPSLTEGPFSHATNLDHYPHYASLSLDGYIACEELSFDNTSGLITSSSLHVVENVSNLLYRLPPHEIDDHLNDPLYSFLKHFAPHFHPAAANTGEDLTFHTYYCVVFYFWLEIFAGLTLFLGTQALRAWMVLKSVGSPKEAFRHLRDRNTLRFRMLMLFVLPVYCLCLYITTRFRSAWTLTTFDAGHYALPAVTSTASITSSQVEEVHDLFTSTCYISVREDCETKLVDKIVLILIFLAYGLYMKNVANKLSEVKFNFGYAKAAKQTVEVCLATLAITGGLHFMHALTYRWGRCLFIITILFMHTFTYFRNVGDSLLTICCLLSDTEQDREAKNQVNRVLRKSTTHSLSQQYLDRRTSENSTGVAFLDEDGPQARAFYRWCKTGIQEYYVLNKKTGKLENRSSTSSSNSSSSSSVALCDQSDANDVPMIVNCIVDLTTFLKQIERACSLSESKDILSNSSNPNIFSNMNHDDLVAIGLAGRSIVGRYFMSPQENPRRTITLPDRSFELFCGSWQIPDQTQANGESMATSTIRQWNYESVYTVRATLNRLLIDVFFSTFIASAEFKNVQATHETQMEDDISTHILLLINSGLISREEFYDIVSEMGSEMEFGWLLHGDPNSYRDLLAPIEPSSDQDLFYGDLMRNDNPLMHDPRSIVGGSDRFAGGDSNQKDSETKQARKSLLLEKAVRLQRQRNRHQLNESLSSTRIDTRTNIYFDDFGNVHFLGLEDLNEERKEGHGVVEMGHVTQSPLSTNQTPWDDPDTPTMVTFYNTSPSIANGRYGKRTTPWTLLAFGPESHMENIMSLMECQGLSFAEASRLIENDSQTSNSNDHPWGPIPTTTTTQQPSSQRLRSHNTRKNLEADFSDESMDNHFFAGTERVHDEHQLLPYYHLLHSFEYETWPTTITSGDDGGEDSAEDSDDILFDKPAKERTLVRQTATQRLCMCFPCNLCVNLMALVAFYCDRPFYSPRENARLSFEEEVQVELEKAAETRSLEITDDMRESIRHVVSNWRESDVIALNKSQQPVPPTRLATGSTKYNTTTSALLHFFLDSFVTLRSAVASSIPGSWNLCDHDCRRRYRRFYCCFCCNNTSSSHTQTNLPCNCFRNGPCCRPSKPPETELLAMI